MRAGQRRGTDESACTPGSVHGDLTASRWAVIHLGLPLPAGSSGPPAGIGRAALERLRRTAADADPAAVPLDLAPGGVYRATPVTRCAVVSYTAVSPLPARALAVCSLWHCPAGHPGSPLATTLPCGARTFLGGRFPRRRDRPADSSVVSTSLVGRGAKITGRNPGERSGAGHSEEDRLRVVRGDTQIADGPHAVPPSRCPRPHDQALR